MNAVKKLLRYLRGYRAVMLLSMLLAAGSVLLTLYVPIIFGDAIDLIIDRGNVDIKGVVSLLARAGIVAAAASLMQWLMNIINNRIALSRSGI